MPESAIRTYQLSRRFGNFLAVDRLDLDVPSGEIFGFLGPNGSGKTTTIRMLCGLLRPSSGTAAVNGYDIRNATDGVRCSLGYMGQRFGLYEDLTIKENIRFYGALYGQTGEPRIQAVMDLTGVSAMQDRRAGHLSGGWKQRLALACAIVHDPTVLLLDEPTAGIDPVARRALWDLLFDLAKGGMTLFVTTHYMDEAERCTSLAYIYQGRLLLCGGPEELKAAKGATDAQHRRIEVVATPLMKAYRILRHMPAVVEVTMFGQALHVLVKQDVSDDLIRHGLSELDILEIRPIQPSLEDVFVGLTQAAQAGRI